MEKPFPLLKLMAKLCQEGYFFLPGFTNLDWLYAAKAVLVSLETINISSKVYEFFSSALLVQKIWNFSEVPTKSSYFRTIKRLSCIHRKYSGSLEELSTAYSGTHK